MRKLSLILFSMLLLVATGCGSGGGNGSAGENAAAGPVDGRFEGVVLETMNSGGYTYVLLEGGGQQIWSATRETPVVVGDQLSVSMDMPMEGFHSDTLDRTFEKVYFVGGFRRMGESAAAPTAAAPHGDDPHGGMMGQAAQDPAEIDLTGIEAPAGGHTVASIWGEREALAGQKVVFRGRVTKFNGGIMDRNWLHVQDGSGATASGDNDITVTTAATCKVGDLVTVTGTIALDKDFGAGYRYALIVEEASIVQEEESAESR